MRARLLEATVELLVEKGYAGTSTTLVSERAGVSRGAQLHHFPTKQDLVVAAVEHVTEVRGAELAAAADEPADRTAGGPARCCRCSATTSPRRSSPPRSSCGWRPAPTRTLLAEVAPLEQKVGRETHRLTVELLGADESQPGVRELVQATLDLVRGLGLANTISDDRRRRTRILDQWATTLDDRAGARDDRPAAGTARRPHRRGRPAPRDRRAARRRRLDARRRRRRAGPSPPRSRTCSGPTRSRSWPRTPTSRPRPRRRGTTSCWPRSTTRRGTSTRPPSSSPSCRATRLLEPLGRRPGGAARGAHRRCRPARRCRGSARRCRRRRWRPRGSWRPGRTRSTSTTPLGERRRADRPDPARRAPRRPHPQLRLLGAPGGAAGRGVPRRADRAERRRCGRGARRTPRRRSTGSAYDFCLLVTQRVHRADTDLVAVGADAEHWLDIAQAFAGPPGPGREATA